MYQNFHESINAKYRTAYVALKLISSSWAQWRWKPAFCWSINLQIATQIVCSYLCNVHTHKGMLRDGIQCYVEIVLYPGNSCTYRIFSLYQRVGAHSLICFTLKNNDKGSRVVTSKLALRLRGLSRPKTDMHWGEYLGTKERKWHDDGGNYISRSSVICIWPSRWPRGLRRRPYYLDTEIVGLNPA